MFDEGRRRHERGEDVIVAALQPNMDPETEEVARTLESVPTLTIDGVPVIDVPAILRAPSPVRCSSTGSRTTIRPEAVIPSGTRTSTSCSTPASRSSPRSISRTSPNSRNSSEASPARSPAQAVPQDFINGADEVVVVDAPPEADTPLQAQQLSQLRQRALLLTADVVDRQLEAYLLLHGIEPSWGTQERILVCMTPRANAAALLASGRRNVDRFHGELFAVYVNQPNLTPEDQSALNRNVMLARAQQAQVDILDGKDPITVILDYARTHGITQIFVGHNLKQTWRTRLTGGLLDRLIDEAEGMDVRVFPH